MLSLSLQLLALAGSVSALVLPQYYSPHTSLEKPTPETGYYVNLGPRPYYLVNNMTEGPLKYKLQNCANGPFSITGFSIGHRGGGTLQIPEESVESTKAGARMGAGILECDVAFTKDRGLVCRHSQCDLHTTTDILLRPALAKKCTQKFKPANGTTPASALCCTSDITTKEFLSLCAKMDASNSSALTVAEYQGLPPTWRTTLYATCAKTQTLASYIDLVDSFPGYRNFTPELKTPPAQVPMPFQTTTGLYTQKQFARDMIETFITRGIDPARVWAQSFLPADIFQWIAEYPKFGAQAVYLDEDGDTPETFSAAVARLPSLKAKGVNVISPAMQYLLTLGGKDNKTFVPSSYATTAMAANFTIIPWTFERSGPLAFVKSRGDYYYTTIANATYFDGQMYEILDVLAREVGISAIFSDWSSTVTYYANCFGIQGPESLTYLAK